MAICLIGLGANLGDREANLDSAIQQLAARVGRLLARSADYRTAPVGGPAGQPEFLNAAVKLETDLAPAAVLAELLRVEQELGRDRTQRWGARSIDLDLLLYEQAVVDSADLVLPHPRMAFRRFVLLPAADVAADMVHPPTGYTIGELLARLDRQPMHIVVLGTNADAAARQAAQRLHAIFFGRTAVSSRPPNSPAPATSLEYLHRVGRCWSATVPASGGVVVSDFWIGEVGVERDQGNDCRSPGGHGEWESLPAVLRDPHLIVWEVEVPDRASRGALWQRVHQPRQSPLLVCRQSPLDQIVDEIVAAAQAMSP